MSNCDQSPKGWWCSRAPGHSGPCAAYPRWWNLKGQRRIREATRRVRRVRRDERGSL